MLRKLLFVALFVVIKSLTSFAQTDYFQQKVQYRIQVRLDPAKHTLHGRLVLDYTNQSPHSLDRLVMHLHPNAYSSHRTAFGQQQIAGGS
ncbi:MAG: M1 family metallopeptidase, partial [Bacteroidetes bacterium]|nr:M1 family metallopeptidase [Bacteroidota bacterium]